MINVHIFTREQFPLDMKDKPVVASKVIKKRSGIKNPPERIVERRSDDNSSLEPPINVTRPEKRNKQN